MGRVIDQPDGTVKFLASWGARSGSWYHVYDCAVVRGRLRRRTIGSLEANVRVFVLDGGDRYVCRFTATDRRDGEPGTLEQQLARGVFQPRPIAGPSEQSSHAAG